MISATALLAYLVMRATDGSSTSEPGRLAGPAGGAYEEARGAESPADFFHKVRIALKEVREARYWLKLTVRAGLVNAPDAIAPLIDGADQLVAILTASANTARRRADHSA
jgi:hypothetical protein